MKKIFYVTLMAVMVMMTACQQTKGNKKPNCFSEEFENRNFSYSTKGCFTPRTILSKFENRKK